MSDKQFPHGGARGNASSSRPSEKRKRGYQDASLSKKLEARRDAFKQQNRLLIPLEEAESRVYQAPPAATNKVTLPEKNKDDVFAKQNFHKPSTIDVASDDVNWYSADKKRPRYAPGYIAKVVGVDPDAAAALAATIIKLAKQHNSNIALCWFEFPGRTASASRAKKPKLSNDREDSRSVEPGLSANRDASLPPPVCMEESSEDGCANCQNAGHALAQCPQPSFKFGNIGGCPLHNTRLHNLDNCDKYAGRDLLSLLDDEVLTLFDTQAFGRSKMPAIRSERFFWLDCLGEAVKRKIIANVPDSPAALELPWTDEYARNMAALKPNDPKLNGNPSPLELCSVEDPAGFWTLLPADPFWANNTVAAVAAEHAKGKLEHLRWVSHASKKKLKGATVETTGSIAPPRGHSTIPAETGPGLTQNDKRNIKIDLRKELGSSGLLNTNGTILLPEEVLTMTPVRRFPDNDSFDNRDVGSSKRLPFDTVRRVVSRYRRCEINERDWDRQCPVERLLMDMVAEARSYLEFCSQRAHDR